MVRTKALMLYPETIWFIYVERASNPTGSCRSVIGIQGQELISDHGLDYLLAEKIKVHVKAEYYRHRAQAQMTWQIDARDQGGGFTRTYPVTESKRISENPDIELPQFLPDEDGRMLDYGHQKSDSNEGRMIRQALHEMAQ